MNEGTYKAQQATGEQLFQALIDWINSEGHQIIALSTTNNTDGEIVYTVIVKI